jgi:hypothetical protein
VDPALVTLTLASVQLLDVKTLPIVMVGEAGTLKPAGKVAETVPPAAKVPGVVFIWKPNVHVATALTW